MFKKMLTVFCSTLLGIVIGGFSGDAFAFSAGASNYACFEDSNGNIFKADVFDFGTGNNNFMVTGWAYMKNSNCKVLGVPLWPMMGSAVLMGNTGATLMGLRFNSPDASLCQNQSGTYMVDNITLNGSGKWSRDDGTWGNVDFDMVGCPYAEGKIASYEGQQPDPALERANLLIGRWTFHETIGTSNFTDVVDLKTVRSSKNTDGLYIGEYWVDGQNVNTHKPAIGGFYPSMNKYTVLSGLTTDLYMDSYSFNISGTSVSNGCYYLYDPSAETVSSCYPLTGTKSALAARAEALQEHNEGMKMTEATGLQKALPVSPEKQALIDTIQDMMSRMNR